MILSIIHLIEFTKQIRLVIDSYIYTARCFDHARRICYSSASQAVVRVEQLPVRMHQLLVRR